MFKKIILLLLIICVAVSGFAQKNKKKLPPKSPKNNYFVMLIDGEETPADRYCPNDSITFDFLVLDTNVIVSDFFWLNSFTIGDTIRNITPIKIAFPPPDNQIDNYRVSLYLTASIDTVSIDTVIITSLNVDFIKTELDTSVCQGRNITVPTLKGDITFYDVQGECWTSWDTIPGVKCDSLVHWLIHVDPYIQPEVYEISSCDSVIWGDSIIRRPPDEKGDYKTTIKRIFPANDPDNGCDTLKTLNVIIIKLPADSLNILFNPDDFCSGDDMGGTITLETNFTAFDWTYKDKDSTFTVTDLTIPIEDPGYYHVLAYMDTGLYEILTDLKIVSSCYLEADTLVEDCPLIIPNVITPNDIPDGSNDVFGIKKLNPIRDNELTISDRWGKTVFHQRNYKCVYKGGEYHNTDGAFAGIAPGGQKLLEGTYYYVFKYASIRKPKTYTGILIILR